MKKKFILFSFIRNERTRRILCFFLVINLLVEIVSPTAALALTSGPTSPEFNSFEPVATTDMVNDFSGDFTYNIPVLNVPGPDGGGYSMSLSYHSGSSCEEEASWVGYGWTLNPGAINRSKRGFPDDFKEVPYETYNKTKPNVNVSSNFNVNIEFSSKDGKNDSAALAQSSGKARSLTKKKFFMDSDEAPEQKREEVASVSFSRSVRFNNYSGFSIANSIGASSKFGGLNMNSSGGSTTLGFNVNPAAIFRTLKDRHNKKNKQDTEDKQKTEDKTTKAPVKNNTWTRSRDKMRNSFGYTYSAHTYNVPALPYSVAKEANASWNFNGSIVVNPANFPLGGQLGFQGNMTMKSNLPKDSKNAVGYLYSNVSNNYSNTGGGYDDKMFDYQVENESVYDKRDKNIGIPFNNADIFSATGNGVIGGFRLQHEKVGTFYPNTNVNTASIAQLGFEIGIGANFQIGFNVGVGSNVTKVHGIWNPALYLFPLQNYHKPVFSSPDDAFMRFTNDMGGEINYDPSSDYSDIPHATIDVIGNPVTPVSEFSLNVNNTSSQSLSGNSSYINYQKTGDLITGIKITNKDGSKCNYTQPVYTKNETELSIGLPTNKDGQYLATASLEYDNPLKNKTVVGSKTLQEYANSYLLTSNTTFNYIDINQNGADEADFGGWTKFEYRKVWGTNANDWYRFRTPYNGLLYNTNRLINKSDQTGSMSSGEKEVFYLKNIETKTHVAFFITNKTVMTDFPQAQYPYLYDSNTNLPLPNITAQLSGTGVDRYDGVDAAGIVNGLDKAAESLTVTGTHKLEKLERVVLFAKNDVSKPLTTTFFEYDYSIAPGIPNTVGTTPAQKGKLTLKKVWTESNGVNRSQISPYVFHYNYFNQYPSELTAKYPWLLAYNALPGNDAKQNPLYTPWQLDPWGNNQLYGDARFMNDQNWVSQTANGNYPSPNLINTDNFDPAAWQLKRIQLPSGGEIHVQYEQKDYLSVQDKHPMAMVSLAYDITNNNAYTSDEARYMINLTDLGIPNDAASIDSYVDMLEHHFIENRNKLYYKFLYAYSGDDDPKLNTQSPRYDHVSGYVTVNDVVKSGNNVFLKLGDLRESIFGEDKGKKDKTLPRWVCYQQLASNGDVNLGLNAGSYKESDYTNDIYGTDGNPLTLSALQSKVSGLAFKKTLGSSVNLFQDWIKGLVKNPQKTSSCKSLSYSSSYFKLPVYNAKKGGGIRVKRILTFDKGIQTGDAMLFGSQYNYVQKNGKTSGIATNEPGSMREENALVYFKERFKQKVMDKVLNGKDTKADEYPIGENIMPSAQVVHSRIVISNIHSGKSTTGFAVNEYYTAKDFPVEVDYTAIKKKPGGGGTFKKFALNLPLGPFNMSINRAWVTQGYLFKLNDMNGKIKGKATYAGNYNVGFDESVYTSKTTYNYTEPGQSIRTLMRDPQTGAFFKGALRAGHEQDYCVFSSNTSEVTCDFSIEVDMNVTLLRLDPTWSCRFSFSSSALKQHSTSRVISQVSHLLSTTNITDGVAQTTENVAFDRYTGDPVLTRTFDGYVSNNKNIFTQNSGSPDHEGYYYSLNIPCSWVNNSMRPLSSNGTTTAGNFNQLTSNAGSIVTYSVNSLYDYLINQQIQTPFSPITTPFTNVVSASATTYTNNWFASTAQLSQFTAPAYTANVTTATLNTANAFFYPLRTYSYRDNVKSSNTAGGRIYTGGTTSTNFNFFNWLNPNANPVEWYSDSKITAYSPFGYPIEEQDVLDIKSAAKFGYNNTLPIAVAQNAGFNQIAFLDFETSSSATTMDAHTGARSFELSLPANQNFNFIPAYLLSSDIVTKKGLGVKFWLKSVVSELTGNTNYGLKNPNPQVKVIIGNVAFNTRAIAQTGDWTLYSADIKSFGSLNAGTPYPVKIGYNFTSAQEKVFVDDFRIQPLDASMNCSVYYADNKLAAQFDDQHFAVMYEYNNKGMLTRKSIETERGKKTLQEQQYNTPLINK